MEKTKDVTPSNVVQLKPAAKPNPLPPLYVRVRHDVWQGMVDTVAFYAKGGADGGAMATATLDRVFE